MGACLYLEFKKEHIVRFDFELSKRNWEPQNTTNQRKKEEHNGEPSCGLLQLQTSHRDVWLCHWVQMGAGEEVGQEMSSAWSLDTEPTQTWLKEPWAGPSSSHSPPSAPRMPTLTLPCTTSTRKRPAI